MGTHFRFGTRTTCGVDGQRQLHEGVPAIPEGVVFTGLNPRELERSRDRQIGIKTAGKTDQPEHDPNSIL